MSTFDSRNLIHLSANRKGVAITVSFLILLFGALPLSIPGGIAEPESSIYPAALQTSVSIQELIDSANTGDTVYVPAGYYRGQVNINKTIRLVGEASALTLIDGNKLGDVVSVTANDVEICGFTIQNSSSRGIGVIFEYCSGVYLHDNVMKDCYEGLAVGGCSNSLVSTNLITSNFGNLGAIINYSTSVAFSKNTVTKNVGGGLVVYHCSNCTISDNQLVENTDKSVVWAVGMVLSNSFNVRVTQNNITDNAYHGLNLVSCHDNEVIDNIMSRNINGICISGSTNNDVHQNTIASNENGVAFYGASNNNIYHNDVSHNALQAYDEYGTERNNFDNGYPSGGNYWSDYNGTDENKDGLGDTPYTIDGNNQDRYPLISPFKTESNVQTAASINIQPNPVRIGQTVLISLAITPPPPTTGDRFDALTLSIFRPDGTVMMRGPFFSDSNGILHTYYMPDLIGNYKIQLTYPGQYFDSRNLTYMASQSPNTTLRVQTQVTSIAWTVDDDLQADFRTIQEAINAASNGDAILVRPGTYQENPVVNKSLSLFGDNSSQTIISAKTSGKLVTVSSSGVTIAGFTIQGFGGTQPQPYNIGVCFVNSVTNCSVSHNLITGHGYGISLNGSRHSVESNYVVDNTISGIYLNGSSNNAITANNVAGVGKTGIFIAWPSGNNVLRNNNMTGENLNLHVISYDIPGFTNDIDTSNTVNGRPVYYWVGKVNQVVPRDAGAVALINCVNITVQDLELSRTGQGILLAFTTGSTIQRNSITKCDNGIRMQSSSSNLLSGNNIYGCTSGLALYQSSNNILRNNTVTDSLNNGVFVFLSQTNQFYYNSFSNKRQLQIDNLANYWDNGREGNYWSDYAGADANGDGIGDMPYSINANNTDRYPLVKTSATQSRTNTTVVDQVGNSTQSDSTSTYQSRETVSSSPIEETTVIDEELNSGNEDGKEPFTQIDQPLSAAVIPIAILLGTAVGIAFGAPLYFLRRKR